MFDAATFTNVSTDTVNLLSAGDFALKNLDWAYEFDGSEFPKQQNSGQNPAYSVVRRMVLTATVQILGSSQSDYWTNRHTFARAFLLTSGTPSSGVFNHGTLSVTPAGGSSMYVDVNVTGLSFPLVFDDAAAAVSTATVTMRADYGYWRATSGGAVVYY